jgi:hypothetical protein
LKEKKDQSKEKKKTRKQAKQSSIPHLICLVGIPK